VIIAFTFSLAESKAPSVALIATSGPPLIEYHADEMSVCPVSSSLMVDVSMTVPPIGTGGTSVLDTSGLVPSVIVSVPVSNVTV